MLFGNGDEANLINSRNILIKIWNINHVLKAIIN